MEAEAKKAAHGFIETVKNKFSGLELSWPKLTEYGAALGGGLVFGFLVRRYGRQTIWSIILLTAFLGCLVYFDFITIDWQKVKEFSGVAPANTIEAFFKESLQWAQKHLIAVIVGAIGFIVGYKIG